MEHTTISEPAGFSRLPKDQQILYIQSLWDRISADSSEIPALAGQLDLAEERLETYRRDPDGAQSAYDMLKEVAREVE